MIPNFIQTPSDPVEKANHIRRVEKLKKTTTEALHQYLRDCIRDVNFQRSEEYKILKEELSTLGYWKNRPRGNPKKGYRKATGQPD